MADGAKVAKTMERSCSLCHLMFTIMPHISAFIVAVKDSVDCTVSMMAAA